MLLNDLKFIYIYFIKFMNASFQNRFTFYICIYIFKTNKKKSEINLIRDIIILFSYIFNAI